VNLAIVDDDRMLLDGVGAWLHQAGVSDIRLVRTATTVDALLAGDLDAEIALLDLNLRDHSAPAENVARLRAADCRVLVISAIPDPEHVLATIEAGAAGYLTKDHDLTELVDAVRRVGAGGSVLSTELAFILSQDSRPARPRLSPQERAVLVAYAHGSTLAAAARRAGVAYGTAREYLERVKRKYAEVGRPAYTKLDLANRLREDRLELDDLGEVSGQPIPF
jgi:DNA-binding NarL/FixJ family response regulator